MRRIRWAWHLALLVIYAVYARLACVMRYKKQSKRLWGNFCYRCHWVARRVPNEKGHPVGLMPVS
jgi:hypothetical protein